MTSHVGNPDNQVVLTDCICYWVWGSTGWKLVFAGYHEGAILFLPCLGYNWDILRLWDSSPTTGRSPGWEYPNHNRGSSRGTSEPCSRTNCISHRATDPSRGSRDVTSNANNGTRLSRLSSHLRISRTIQANSFCASWPDFWFDYSGADGVQSCRV